MKSDINNRVTLACDITTHVLMNPEAMVNFICITANEVSLTDLQRVYYKFFHSLKDLNNKMNLKN